MKFHAFKQAVAQQFTNMTNNGNPLFTTAVGKDELWEAYLLSYPEGTNEIFRVRREYDCSACRGFIRTLGGVVSIDPKTLEIATIWDITVDVPEFQVVADKLAAFVRSKATISNMLIMTERTVGCDKNYERLMNKLDPSAPCDTLEFEHFYVRLPAQTAAPRGTAIGNYLSNQRASFEVFKRSCIEITDDAIATVLELADQNSLYRGEEFAPAIREFASLRLKFLSTEDRLKDNYCWSVVANKNCSSQNILRIRNMAIGTLLIDLSEGKDLEAAVSSFEAMVAPMNYRRTTALVTPAMVEKAKAEIKELGLENALIRRHAHMDDLDVTNLLFVDRECKAIPTGSDDLFDVATKAASSNKNAQDITIADFIEKVLPTATKLELCLSRGHANNMVSLTTVEDPTAKQLFSWDNPFAWSYVGDVTDSIKERVKRAGGNVSGEFRCSLSWESTDDLDLHLLCENGEHVHFANKIGSSGIRLDIDMNAPGTNLVTNPVENIYAERLSSLIPNALYRLLVHNYQKRNHNGEAFTVEFVCGGEVKTFESTAAIPGHGMLVVEFKYNPNSGLEIIKSLPESKKVKEIWGIRTGDFVPVKAMMYSPNHWGDNKSGNKHYFFMLEGCLNPEGVRGFYNEYLRGDLREHRKVFELVGAKATTAPSDNQLSGVGFSSTQRNTVVCRVHGAHTRTFNINF